MIYYNFTAPSALSFAVMHQGRKLFVNFSIPVNGVARYLTTDKELAAKICKHRWYRMGIISLREQKEEAKKNQHPKKEDKPVETPLKKAVYSILNKTMAPHVCSFDNPVPAVNLDNLEIPAKDVVEKDTQNTPGTSSSDDADKQGVETHEFTAETVTSFLEAKEYFTTVVGVNRSLVTSKEALASLCAQYGIEFPNYQLKL